MYITQYLIPDAAGTSRVQCIYSCNQIFEHYDFKSALIQLI